MKRHEYLHSAILAFVSGALFALAGCLLQFIVLKEIIEDSDGYGKILFTAVPMSLYAVGAVFVIIGLMSLANEIEIERGDDVVAEITGIKEYFYGKGTSQVHYNLFCQWRCPTNGRMYRYMVKNIPTNPKDRFPDKKIRIRVSRKNPRLHFIDF